MKIEITLAYNFTRDDYAKMKEVLDQYIDDHFVYITDDEKFEHNELNEFKDDYKYLIEINPL
jgi:hypothetical protein